MISSLKFLLSLQLKRLKINQTNKGFTLIELLVAIILAFLVITPLMMFMMGVLDSDRREQAKATTEQEIQAALDYIARDLQQAVYIYDADGVTRGRPPTPPPSPTPSPSPTPTTSIADSGIKDEIPPVKSAPNCSDSSVCTPILVFWKREFVAGSVGVSSDTDPVTDDGFAYSLVAYYLITNTNGANTTWSRSARIGRFELRGSVNAANANSRASANTGFNPPPLSDTFTGSTLKERMNQWRTALGASENYGTQTPVVTLVDFISTTGPTGGACPSPRLVGSLTSGFFACVDAAQVVAQVSLRGNAFARLYNNNNIAFSNSVSTYFPTASIRAQGRGFLFTK